MYSLHFVKIMLIIFFSFELSFTRSDSPHPVSCEVSCSSGTMGSSQKAGTPSPSGFPQPCVAVLGLPTLRVHSCWHTGQLQGSLPLGGATFSPHCPPSYLLPRWAQAATALRTLGRQQRGTTAYHLHNLCDFQITFPFSFTLKMALSPL